MPGMDTSFDGVTVTPDGFRAATPPCSVVKFLVK